MRHRRNRLRRRYGRAQSGTRLARNIKVGDVILAPSSSGLSMVESRVIDKTIARRVFSGGKAYDLTLQRHGIVHQVDRDKTWRVYALAEDKFEVVR